jgi:hypothetical protein
MTDPTLPIDSTDPLAAFDAAHARVEQISREARANAVHASRVSDAARSTQATVRSPRGEVSVTSKAGGVISAIEFSEAALELAATDLARLTVTTIAQAQHAATVQFAELTADEFAANPQLAASLRADAERAFPSPDAGLRY